MPQHIIILRPLLGGKDKYTGLYATVICRGSNDDYGVVLGLRRTLANLDVEVWLHPKRVRELTAERVAELLDSSAEAAE